MNEYDAIFAQMDEIKEKQGESASNSYLQFAIDMMLRRNGHQI